MTEEIWKTFTPTAVKFVTDQEPLVYDWDQTDVPGQSEINSQDRGIQAAKAAVSLASVRAITIQADVTDQLSLREEFPFS